MELTNVIILYVNPATKLGNGVGVFNAFHKAQSDIESQLFVKYIINWIANAKMIFIVLLVVVLFTATQTTKFYTCIAMLCSIALYYITLHPLIKKLDNNGYITPKGYSNVLFGMITGFMLMFVVGIIIYLL